MGPCCELTYEKYIVKAGELSKEALDKIFGENSYQIVIEKYPYSKKDSMDFIFGKGKYIFVENGIKTLNNNKFHFIKDINREFDYVYKIIVNGWEGELCGCDCHVIGLNVMH